MAITRWVSIGKESTFGTAVAGKYFMDPSRVSLDAPSDPFLRYGGASGRGVRAIVPGMYAPEGDVEGVVDTWRAGILFRAFVPELNYQQQSADKSATTTTLSAQEAAGQTVLSVVDATGFVQDRLVQVGADGAGSEVFKMTNVDQVLDEITIDDPLSRTWPSGTAVVMLNASPDVLHILDVGGTDNILDSFTVRAAKDFDEQVFAGSVLSQLQLNVDHNSLMTYTASFVSQKDTPGSVTALPATGLLTVPYAGSLLTVAKLEEAETPGNFKDIISYIRGAQITFNNNVSSEEGVRMNSRFPIELRGRALDVTARLTLVFRNRDQYEDFWGAAGGAAEGTMQPRDLRFRWTLSTDLNVEVYLYNGYLITPVSEVSGRDMLVQTLEYEAIQQGPYGVAGVMGAFRYMSMKDHRYF